ncbi:HIT-like protein [Daldinia caldariorum]|uniref:HIT-like protein n=1 Tax=Daldinia caldariorum TaxID=326644 RepID=UPI002008C437|nr:HIT-like protein [Daldinia caldariorum]KAI1465745.1 HIT-like protein [Daldinia caldariorum]
MRRSASSRANPFFIANLLKRQSNQGIQVRIQRKMSSSSRSKISGPIHFGPFEVTPQVFLTTPHSFALVNLKPLLPGHVLVCPRRPYKWLTELSAPEITDLFCAVQRVQRMLARHYFSSSPPSSSSSNHHSSSSPSSSSRQQQQQQRHDVPEAAGSFNIAIQDGPEAGQTVPHVHVHVIPRIRGSTAKEQPGPGDQIYESMAAEEGNVGGALWDRELNNLLRQRLGSRPEPGGSFPSIEDSERHPRTAEEMAAEADVFRKVLEEMGEEDEEAEAKQ